jgi:hypothetical protein
MSSLVSGITKVFSSLGSGLATGAATLGSAIRGIGASFFTAGAATGQSAASGTGIFSKLFGGGSTLGNIFSGVSSVLGGGPGAAIPALAAGGAAGAAAIPAVAGTAATGLGTAMNAGAGPWGPLGLAESATGFAPAGVSASTGFGKVADFFGSTAGTNLLTAAGGIGESISEYQKIKSQEDMNQANIDYLNERQAKITEGYTVPNSALAGGTTWSGDAPVVKKKGGAAWEYDDKTGKIIKAA